MKEHIHMTSEMEKNCPVCNPGISTGTDVFLTGMSHAVMESQIHDLKLAAPYFDAVAKGIKTFEVRRDDRGFQKGDILRLYKWGPDKLSSRMGYLDNYDWVCEKESVMSITARVEYILTGGQYGIEPGYVVMGISLIPT